MPGGRLAGVLLVLLSTAAFAIGPTAAKLAYVDGSNTLTVVTLRGVIGMALMGGLIAASGTGFRVGRRTLLACFLAGLACAAMSYGFIGSVAHIPVSLAVVIFFAHPVLVAAMWHWLGRERLTRRKLLLTLLASAGVALALGGSLSELDPAGAGLAALAAVSMCGMIYFSAQAQEGATSTQVNFHLTSVTVLLFGSLTTGIGGWAFPAGAVGWLGLAAAGIGITIGMLAFFAAFRFIGPVRATVISSVEPLFGILFAVALLGERLDPLQWAGVALVVAALILFEMPVRRRALRDAA